MAPDRARIQALLGRLRLATRTTLWIERALVALWPALGILGGFVCLALLGLPPRFPAPLQAALLAGVLLAVGWAVWHARAALGWPGQEAADRRLERAAGLAHRPLAALTDRPAGTGAELWPLHQARALAQVARLRLGWPEPAFPSRDPRAVRLLLLLGLTIGVVIAGPDASERLWRAIAPHFPPAPAVPALEIRAWAAPPAFTGLPPALLPDSGEVRLPAGSRLTISLSGGGGGAPALVLAGASRAFDAIGAGSFQVQADLAGDGLLSVQRDGTEVARWVVTLVPDVAPVVSWSHPPSILRGRLPRVRLAWKASHAYGVAALAAEFRLRDRPAAPPLSLAIPLTGRPREAAGTTATDLTAHPWAGLPVTVVLSGRDGAGLVGTGPAAELVLPARRFRQPGAQALVAVRQMLALAPQDGAAAASALRQAAGRAPLWPEGDPAPDSARAIAAMLEGSPPSDAPPTDATIAAAQARLWELALRLEEGTTQRTADALRRAQQALRSALDPAAPAEARDKAEIERRADALARAMQRHQEALAQQAQRVPGSATPVTPQDRQAAEQALQRLREAARSDRMDDAREQMSELDQMLDQMRRAGRSQAQRKRDEGREKGRAQVGVLQDLVRRQAGQIDHAEARLAQPTLADPSADTAGAAQRDHDRAVQLALRRVLGELMQQHGDLTGSVPKNLGDADAAMREAATALADGHDDAASAAALRAVEALQQGGQEMGQQLARQFGQPSGEQDGQDGQAGDEGAQPGESGQQADGQDGTDPDDQSGEMGEALGDGDGQGGEQGSLGADGEPLGRRRDPFGRATQEGLLGSDGGRDTRVPEEMEQARGRAVQEELRRREAQRTRPPQELDYIGRLLKQE